MRTSITIGLIGDFDADVPAHRAIPLALNAAAESLRVGVAFEWVATDAIRDASRVAHFDGLWCVR